MINCNKDIKDTSRQDVSLIYVSGILDVGLMLTHTSVYTPRLLRKPAFTHRHHSTPHHMLYQPLAGHYAKRTFDIRLQLHCTALAGSFLQTTTEHNCYTALQLDTNSVYSCSFYATQCSRSTWFVQGPTASYTPEF